MPAPGSSNRRRSPGTCFFLKCLRGRLSREIASNRLSSGAFPVIPSGFTSCSNPRCLPPIYHAEQALRTPIVNRKVLGGNRTDLPLHPALSRAERRIAGAGALALQPAQASKAARVEPDEVEQLRDGVADPRVLGRVWDRYRDRLRRVVRLRMDRRLQGRVDPSDVLQEAFLDFQSRAQEYTRQRDVPFFLWLRFLVGQRLLLLHRYHLGTQMRDAGREVSLHHGAMPQATSISLAAQLLGRFTSVTQAVQRAEMQMILQEAINNMDPMDREILALRHFEELSNEETAQVLDIKPSAASSRHIRALKRLRDILKNTPGFFDKERE
jgi:RNA polymerase sigma-70 factor (ECF subfamily)